MPPASTLYTQKTHAAADTASKMPDGTGAALAATRCHIWNATQPVAPVGKKIRLIVLDASCCDWGAQMQPLCGMTPVQLCVLGGDTGGRAVLAAPSYTTAVTRALHSNCYG